MNFRHKDSLVMLFVLAFASVTQAECLGQTVGRFNDPCITAVHDFGKMTELWNDGKYDEIEALYGKALRIEEKQLGPNHPDIAFLLKELAMFYDRRGLSAKSEPLFKRALSIMDKNPGTNDDDLKDVLDGLGFACERDNQLAQAEGYFRRALALEDKRPEEEATAMSLDRLAQVLVKQEKYAEAKPLYKRSLAMREKTYGKDSRDVKIVLDRLAELNRLQGNQKESGELSMRSTNIQASQLGPILGPFFLKQSADVNSHNCILPLASDLGPGSRFDEMRFTAALKKKLGSESIEWCKIPDWMAGLWQSRPIPPNTKVKEVNGAIVDSHQLGAGFYQGPGPYAIRMGFIKAMDGWWHYRGGEQTNFWSRGSRDGDPFMTYEFYHTHQPVSKGDGSVRFRRSTIFFRVKPDKTAKNIMEVLLPSARVVSVWQEDVEDVYAKHSPDKLKHFSATRINGWDGKRLSKAPGDPNREEFQTASFQKLSGKPAASRYEGVDLQESLNNYLSKANASR